MTDVNNVSEKAGNAMDAVESKLSGEQPSKEAGKTLTNSHGGETTNEKQGTPNGNGEPHDEKSETTSGGESTQSKDEKPDTARKPENATAAPAEDEPVMKVTVPDQEAEPKQEQTSTKETAEKKPAARGRGAPKGKRGAAAAARGKAKEENDAGASNAEPDAEKTQPKSEHKPESDADKNKQTEPDAEKKQEPAEEAGGKATAKKPGRKRGAAKESESTAKVTKTDEGGPSNAQQSADDKKTPLLETPLIIEGKRQRQKVERLDSKMLAAQTHREHVDFPEGSGTKLGEIPFVEAMITKTPADDLKPLHRLCFGRPGSTHDVRRHLRTFRGFDFEKGTDGYSKKLKSMEQWGMKQVKKVCEVLGLERGGKAAKKEDLQASILDFLIKPADTGKQVPQSKRQRAASKKGKGKGRARAKKATASASEVSESDGSGAEGEESEAKEEDHEEEEEGKESEPEPPKAKKAKKAAPPKKETAPEEASTSKKAPRGRGAGKAAKKSPPSDDALKATIKDLLKGANLEEITMRDMCRKVFAKYPDFDLADRKDFIKDTVKSIISSSTE